MASAVHPLVLWVHEAFEQNFSVLLLLPTLRRMKFGFALFITFLVVRIEKIFIFAQII